MVPEILYKKSNIKQDWTSIVDSIYLAPVAYSKAVGITVNAEARCEQGIRHGEAPSKSCYCGFHAYKEISDAQAHDQRGDFIFRVVASGKMFEYNKGYRYGHQRVEEIIVSSCCTCSEFADRLSIQPAGYIRPVCFGHSGTGGGEKIISFSDLAEMASSSLPANAPNITVRSINPSVFPWEKGISVRKITNSVKFRNTSKEGFPFGTVALVTFAAAMAILSGRQDARR